MIHIAICDDEKNIRIDLKQKLEKYSQESGNVIRIFLFEDGEDLIANYKIEIDLIFLDIEMKEIDGVAAAEKIREIDKEVGIIFLTSYKKYALKGYQVGAINYIIKPIRYARLKNEMDDFLEKQRVNPREFIVVTNEAGKQKILLKDLKYAETEKGNVVLHTADKKMLVYMTMKELQQLLPPEYFQRCHASFIVNMDYINGVKKLEIELLDGEIIPISQPKRKEFMEAMAKYWGNLL